MDDWPGAEHGPAGGPGVPGRSAGAVDGSWTLAVAAPPVRHRPWSTVLLALHVIAVVGGALALVGGGAMLAISATAPEPTDGINEPWGIVIGAILAAFGAVVLVAAGILTMATVRGRRAADVGRAGTLRGVSIAALVLAGLGPFGSLTSGDMSTFVVLLVPAGIYALPAIRILQTTGGARKV